MTSSCPFGFKPTQKHQQPTGWDAVSEGRDTLSPVMVSAGSASGGQAGPSVNICVQFGYEMWTNIHLRFLLSVWFSCTLILLFESLQTSGPESGHLSEYSAENLKRKCCNHGSNAGP